MTDPIPAALVERMRQVARVALAEAKVAPTEQVQMEYLAERLARAFLDGQRELRMALDESVKLQSHYAGLLNDYDGGQRIQFLNADAFLQRLAMLRRAAAERCEGETK